MRRVREVEETSEECRVEPLPQLLQQHTPLLVEDPMLASVFMEQELYLQWCRTRAAVTASRDRSVN